MGRQLLLPVAACMINLFFVSTTNGQAVISLLEPLSFIAHRPSQFSLYVHKTGSASSPVTVIVEV